MTVRTEPPTDEEVERKAKANNDQAEASENLRRHGIDTTDFAIERPGPGTRREPSTLTAARGVRSGKTRWWRAVLPRRKEGEKEDGFQTHYVPFLAMRGPLKWSKANTFWRAAVAMARQHDHDGSVEEVDSATDAVEHAWWGFEVRKL